MNPQLISLLNATNVEFDKPQYRIGYNVINALKHSLVSINNHYRFDIELTVIS